jgi:hypothetical protein
MAVATVIVSMKQLRRKSISSSLQGLELLGPPARKDMDLGFLEWRKVFTEDLAKTSQIIRENGIQPASVQK